VGAPPADVEAGYADARPAGALVDAAWGIAAGPVALARAGEFQRAHDLRLGEARGWRRGPDRATRGDERLRREDKARTDLTSQSEMMPTNRSY